MVALEGLPKISANTSFLPFNSLISGQNKPIPVPPPDHMNMTPKIGAISALCDELARLAQSYTDLLQS